MADFTNAFVTIDNTILTMATNLRIRHDPALIQVLTMALGLAGMAEGAPLMEVTIDSAVPSATWEIEGSAKYKKGMKVDFGAVVANSQLQQSMWITSLEFTRGVGNAPALSMSLIGPYKEWE